MFYMHTIGMRQRRLLQREQRRQFAGLAKALFVFVVLWIVKADFCGSKFRGGRTPDVVRVEGSPAILCGIHSRLTSNLQSASSRPSD